MNDRRLCTECGKAVRKDSQVGICRRPSCRNAYRRRYHELFPEQRSKTNDRQHKYAQGRDQAAKQSVQEYNKEYKRRTPVKQGLHRARGRAKKAGLECDLTEDTMPPMPDTCPVLGLSLCPGDGRMTDNSPTLDRIDSTKGYVAGNVHWISWRANSLKKDATVDELIKLAEYFGRLAGR